MTHFRKAGKALAFFLLFLFLLPLAFTAKCAEPPAMAAASVLLADPATGQVLYSTENMHEPLYAASLTKIMTALVTLEQCSDLSEITTISQDAIAANPRGGSTSGLQAGEQLPLLDVLYCLLLPSGNEASFALAEHVAGSTEAFARKMNERARELGCENTVFYNPCGYPDENVTSAYDLFLITREALKNETFATIVETAQHKIKKTNLQEERTVLTTNLLILRRSDPLYYASCFGVKTGTTEGAGNCLVSFATKDSETLISVMLGSERDLETRIPLTFSQTRDLFEWGFDSFVSKELLASGEPILEVPVRLSAEKDKVLLRADGSIQGMVPVDLDLEDITRTLETPEELIAPLTAGDVIGSLTLSYDGFTYGTVNLVAVQDISFSKVLYFVDLLDNFFKSRLFYILLAVVGGLLVLYILLIILLHRRRKRRRASRHTRRGGYRNYRGNTRR